MYIKAVKFPSSAKQDEWKKALRLALTTVWDESGSVPGGMGRAEGNSQLQGPGIFPDALTQQTKVTCIQQLPVCIYFRSKAQLVWCQLEILDISIKPCVINSKHTWHIPVPRAGAGVQL